MDNQQITIKQYLRNLKTGHLFVGAVIFYTISFGSLYILPESIAGGFSGVTGIIGLILLVLSVISLSRGKIPAGKKIFCPNCKGQAREYRSMAIKIIYPLLFLTPKYICTDCKKLFDNPDVTSTSSTNKTV